MPVNNLSAKQNGILHYQIEVPAGAANLTFAISGGRGDADLYVKYGKAPTLDDFDYRPYQPGNTESVDISPTQAGIYYVALHGYEAFSDVSLVGQYQIVDSTAPIRTFINNANAQIPDMSIFGVKSAIDVPDHVNSDEVTIDINIKHRKRGDLMIWLVSPKGKFTTIKPLDFFDTQPNFQANINLNVSGIDVTGRWRLRIIDISRGNTGYLDRWSMTFK